MRVSPLTETERGLLIEFYESDHWKALKKLMAHQQLKIAMDNLQAQDHGQTRFNQGQCNALDWIAKELEIMHKKYIKKGKE